MATFQEKRLSLHNKLLGKALTWKIYYNPDPSVKMAYPCIVYKLAGVATVYANNEPYLIGPPVFTVTCITSNRDDEIPFDILTIQGAVFETQFMADNLCHTVIQITAY